MSNSRVKVTVNESTKIVHICTLDGTQGQRLHAGHAETDGFISAKNSSSSDPQYCNVGRPCFFPEPEVSYVKPVKCAEYV